MDATLRHNGQYTFTMDEDEYVDLDDEFMGLCTYCGDVVGEVDPDCEHGECPSCNHPSVYGAEQAMMLGLITFEED